MQMKEYVRPNFIIIELRAEEMFSSLGSSNIADRVAVSSSYELSVLNDLGLNPNGVLTYQNNSNGG